MFRFIKAWFYRDELNALSALDFAARIGDGWVTTYEWEDWAKPFGVERFHEVRYRLESKGLVSYFKGRYRITAEGRVWYRRLRYAK